MLGACETAVHIRLSPGDDPLMNEECSLAAGNMASFYLELVREGDGQGLAFNKCADVIGQPASLAQLEAQLAGRIVFDDVPPGDGWKIWVEGFSSLQCRNTGGVAPLLCGVQGGLGIPPPGDEIVVDVSCVAGKHFTWTSESLQSCRVK